MSAAIKTFAAVPGDDFGAQRAAEDWLRERGFSFGSSQADGPQAIWHGDCRVSKWRNLSTRERRDAHAIMGGARASAVCITLRAHAPAEALAIFKADDEATS